ncbi:MAG: hypothetical protein A2X77_03915 [Gammaproteobacteria bacterium GWE2_42_36]|nr:MAG: hypothetical protein A2X77_03915 [Gammaproteobacteria bacterium GWE2_42_36]
MKSTAFHVIKDPIHGSIQLTSQEDHWIKPFLDSENFQRLRHIKQLGLADWIFPGALHNRFVHCLGCCYIINQICHKLDLPEQDRQLVMIAGLLHDIGHGPFSHSFEEIFATNSIKHEAWTPFFLDEYRNDSFIQRFNQRNRRHTLSVEKIDLIERLIMHQPIGNKLLSDMVSSQLDADRLDYLLRDSHFCGVTYGTYDLQWLLHCLTPICHQDETRLGITYKGIGVTEQYLMARRLMMRNVYQNAKKHGAEFLLQQFLKQVAKTIHDDQLPGELSTNTLVQFLKALMTYQQNIKQTNNKALEQTFMQSHFHLYKQLGDYDIFALIRLMAHGSHQHFTAVKIASRLQRRQLPKIMPVCESNLRAAKDLLDEFNHQHQGKMESWQLGLIDLTHLSYQAAADPILVEDISGNTHLLQENSPMIDAISDKRENTYLVCIDQEAYDKFRGKQLFQALQQR